MATTFKYRTIVSHEEIMEEEEKEEVKEEENIKKTNINNIECDKPDLTDKECELLSSQIYVLSDKTLQKDILNEVLSVYPSLTSSFSTVSGVEGQSSFLLTMIKKGYDMVLTHSYNSLYNIIVRHSRYGISEQCMRLTFTKTLEIAVKTIENESEIESERESSIVWRKANDILINIMRKAYKKQKRQNGIKKNRAFISRSMSENDIKCVVSVWNKLIIEHKDKLSILLAQKIQKNIDIYIVFQRYNIDIFKQSSVIINMLDTTINELSNTDQLIPFLMKIGEKHVNMNIKPQLLATMKKIILNVMKEILSFNYTDDMKQAWNRVLAFIVGMMINSSYSTINREYDISTSSDSSGNLYDIEQLESGLTPSVIRDCQLSWQRIESVIDRAVQIFYNNLSASKQEIKQLFSKTNMVQQSQRLVKAIGSMVALLDEIETLIPILEELGKRHVFYGVRPEHFKYVKNAWFKMLKQALSLNWNDNINKSWNITWTFITYYMKRSLEDSLLLYIPPEPVLVNLKVIINHIDIIKLNNSTFYGDIHFNAYTGSNKSQSYIFGCNRYNRYNEESLLPPFVNIRCLNAMQTEDKCRTLKQGYIRYFEDDDSWYLRGNIIGTYSNIFNLDKYPFDTHNINIIFSLEVDDTVAIFNENELYVRLMPFKDSMAGCNYTVYEPEICLIELNAIKGGSISGKRF